MSYKARMNGGGESHNGIVPAKRSNEGQGGPKEIVEGRLLTKEKEGRDRPVPDQSRNTRATNPTLRVKPGFT